MNRIFLLTGALALAVLVTGVAVQADDKAEGPSIKEIMKTSHDMTDGYRAKASAAVKAKKWEDAESAMKSWLKDAEDLKKAKPSKGKPDSWKKLTAAYEKTVKALAKDVDSKDAKAFAGDNKKINCGACHKAHKPAPKK